MKYIRTAGSTRFECKTNLSITKELKKKQSWNPQKITEIPGETMCFECSAQQSSFIFTVTNQMDEEIWGEPTNAGTRP
jgi:hypothetical protein